MQPIDEQYLMEDIREGIEKTVRKEVDKLMRQELDCLIMAIDKTRPTPSKRTMKENKSKEKKKKTLPDLSPDTPVEELFRELVYKNIIKKVSPIPLSAFIGSFTMAPSEAGEQLQDLADVRRMVFDFAVLPMSSANLHSKAPYIKSILLAGPSMSGKKMLVHAVCFELGATLFDLTASNLGDKWEDDEDVLMSMIYKIAISCQPAVILIDSAHLMCTKSSQLSEEQQDLNPGRIKRDLMRMLKILSKEDRILLIGTTNNPSCSNIGQVFKVYNRLISLFPPSHASRYALWEGLIVQEGGILHPGLSLTALSAVSKGFTAGVIDTVVKEVLSPSRRLKQNTFPLQCLEFVKRLALYDPVYRSELTAFKDWISKTPLAKKRLSQQKSVGSLNEHD